jgi:hypothetical protein
MSALARRARELTALARAASSRLAASSGARAVSPIVPVVPSARVVTRADGLSGAPFAARAYASKGKKQSKSKSSQGKRSKARGGMQAPPVSARVEQTTKGNRDVYLDAITPPETYDVEDSTPEELMEYEARAKAYSRAKMAASRAFQADINEKIRIKKAAVEALPEGAVRDAARVEDLSLFPLKRKLPTHTPPIDGFYEEKQRLAEEAVSGGAALKK